VRKVASIRLRVRKKGLSKTQAFADFNQKLSIDEDTIQQASSILFFIPMVPISTAFPQTFP
jgi:hypothetical protein